MGLKYLESRINTPSNVDLNIKMTYQDTDTKTDLNTKFEWDMIDS